MRVRLAEIIAFLIVAASFVAGVYFYPLLPNRVASHWGIDGEVDGYVSRFWGAYLMPIVGAGLWLLLLIVLRVDPKKHNIEKFLKHFDWFIVLLFLFLAYLFGLVLIWNLGYSFELIRWLSPAFTILFFSAGVLISNAKMNWTIGIRTPWTLSSEKVWNKTHKTGGILFRISGILALFGTLLPRHAAWFILAPVIVSAVIVVVQSYVEYHREHIRDKS